ncbi:MAG: nickel-binding protein [Halobacteriales archaeon]
MSDQDQELIDFGIWRDVEDDLDREDIMEAGEAAREAVKELREEGIEIEHGISDVLEDDDGNTDCVYCHYRAPDEEAVREHSKRAGEKVDTDTFTVSRLRRVGARDDFSLPEEA